MDAVQIKVLGALGMIDQGETDWKVIAIGTAQVGCNAAPSTLGATTTTVAGAAPSGNVPATVLASFGEHCPAA